MNRILDRIKRRPMRVVEAVLALAAALGVTVAPELADQAKLIIGVLAGLGVVGGEAAQLATHSKAYVYEDLQGGDKSHDDRLPDAGDANPPLPGVGYPDLPDLPED